VRLSAFACLFFAAIFQNAHAQLLPIERLDHYAINSINIEKSAAWYGEVFGMTPIRKWDGVWMIGNGSARVGIFQAPANSIRAPNPEKAIGFLHVAFSIPAGQREAVKARLSQAGIAFREEDIGIAISLFLNDPDGNELELIQYK
jgi:catechol 2,3-dioxygenase-like lactoylglutathione lyase family enzyme